MHTHAERVQMLLDRLQLDDPTMSAVEVVLLRSAFERLDDFLIWLDSHVATDHGDDASTSAVLQMIGGVRNKLARELRVVDEALSKINT
jgi:hypothetical protein